MPCLIHPLRLTALMPLCLRSWRRRSGLGVALVFIAWSLLAAPLLSQEQSEGQTSPAASEITSQAAGETPASANGNAISTSTATPPATPPATGVSLKLTAEQQALLERGVARIEGLSARLDGIDQELLSENGLPEERLVQLRSLLRSERSALEELHAELTSSSAPISVKLADLNANDDETSNQEDAGLASLRGEIEALLAPFLTLTTQADTLLMQMDRQLGLIADQRRDLFLANIFTPTPAVYSASFWKTVPELVSGLAQSTSSLIAFRLKAISTQMAKPGVATSLLVYVLFSLALLALPLALLHRYAQRRQHKNKGGQAGRLAIVEQGLSQIWPPLWLLLSAWGFVLLFQVQLNLVSSFSWLLTSLAGTLSACLLVARLPQWLDQLSALPAAAGFLTRADTATPAQSTAYGAASPQSARIEPLLLVALTLLVSLQFLLQGLIDIFDKPVESEWLVALVFAPMLMMGLFWLLRLERYRRLYLQFFPWIFGAWPLRWTLRNSPWLALAGLILGFIAMVGFVLPRLWIVLMVFLLAAGLRLSLYLWLDSTAEQQAERQSDLSEASPVLEGQESASDIQRFWLVLAVNTLLLALGLPLVLMLLGYDAWALLAWLDRIAQPIAVGSLNLSPFNLILGAALFGLAWMAVRYVKVIMAEQVLPRTNLMADVRHSLVTLLGYVGFTIAGLVGLGVAGLDLSRFALIAGALSVGIGFGLQAIVSNFVSGLILLFERPVKLGDWVVLASGEGIVKRISIRATEIETFDGRAIMVPNSELISSPVANWTHRSHKGRVMVTVGVAYESDPKVVEALLYQVANDNPLVLRAPAPMVYLADFGASSLDFQLRVHIADIFNVLTVSHQLRLAIFEAFQQNDISIPFPQQELRIKTETDAIQFASPVMQVDVKPDPPRDA